MLTIREAWAAIDAAVQPLDEEDIQISEAHGRVTSQAVMSKTALPPFDQSALDGVVAYADDVVGASEATPVELPISAEIAAGCHDDWPTLEKGTVARIFTGAPVPSGPVTMIPREVLELHDGVCVLREARPEGANIRRAGEEIAHGDEILAAGTTLLAGTVAAVSMAGVRSVRVRKRPRLAILTTGDEVVPPGESLKPGQVYDANQVMLQAWAKERNIEIVLAEHVRDTEAALSDAIGRAADKADVIVTTGGVSVGKHDHVIACAESRGFEREFWKVAQKPGKPLYFATRSGQPLLGLPGNPGAVFAGIHAFLDRVIDRLESRAVLGKDLLFGRLDEAVRGRSDRDQWLRVYVSAGDDSETVVRPLEGQGSHMLGNLAEANAIAWIPSGTDRYEAGERVQYFHL